MARRGRPRKVNAKRKPSGRIAGSRGKKEDVTEVVVQQRVKAYGLSPQQARSSLAGYLAGVLYLQGKLGMTHLGHYYSYVQSAPRGAKAIEYRERVQSTTVNRGIPVSQKYIDLVHAVGRDISHLEALTNNRLTCSIARLKRILRLVPLSNGAHTFMMQHESPEPSKHRR